MKQLIPQLKIDEAATNATENRFDLKGLIAYGDIYEQGFRCGVQFALNEIQPLVCEFSEWCTNNYLHKGTAPDGKEMWIDRDYYIDHKTTQQLLEEFINSKNK